MVRRLDVAIAAIGVGARHVGGLGGHGRPQKVLEPRPADGLSTDAVNVVVTHPLGPTVAVHEDLRTDPKVAVLSGRVVIGGRRRAVRRLVTAAVASAFAPDAASDPCHLRTVQAPWTWPFLRLVVLWCRFRIRRLVPGLVTEQAGPFS